MMQVEARGLGIALQKVGTILAFGVLPAALIVAFVVVTIGGSHPFYDFNGDIYEAGRAILHGRNPYDAAFLQHLVAIKNAGGSPSLVFAVPVYPAPTLLVFAPLALFSTRLAGLLFTIGSVVALLWGLRLAGVRDWRCYGAALLSWPTVEAVRLGALEPLLLLGLALVWKWRHRAATTGAIAGLIVPAKLFLWPVAGWALATRRWRMIAFGVLVAVLVTLAAWAVIDFHGIRAYPTILGDDSTLVRAAGVSWISAGAAIGVSSGAAEAVSLVVAFALLGLAWRLCRSGDENGEARGFGVTIVAALVACPVVWAHYLVLLYLPVALICPTLSLLWFVPLLDYFSPVELTRGDIWEIVPALVIELVVLLALWAPFPGITGLKLSRPQGSDRRGRNALLD